MLQSRPCSTNETIDGRPAGHGMGTGRMPRINGKSECGRVHNLHDQCSRVRVDILDILQNENDTERHRTSKHAVDEFMHAIRHHMEIDQACIPIAMHPLGERTVDHDLVGPQSCCDIE